MPIETIEFQGKSYPKLQSIGFAAQWCMPFAKEILKPDINTGWDIGCGKEEWALPGALPIDINLGGYNAMNLPALQADYIFSSHCLEHLPDWVGVLNYWHSKLKPGGILFLYLPHPSQCYWKPWNNRKHVNILHPDMLREYFNSIYESDKPFAVQLYKSKWENIHVTEGFDLNHSFYAIAQKR